MALRIGSKAKWNILTRNRNGSLVQRKFAYAKTDYATCNEQRRDATTVTSLQHTHTHTQKQESARPETWSPPETIRWPLTLGAFTFGCLPIDHLRSDSDPQLRPS